MRKYITLILLVLAVCGASFGQSFNDGVIRTISLTTTGTTTADAVKAVPTGVRWSVLGVYQSVNTETNDCDMKVYLNGTTTSEAVTKVALVNVTNTTAIENVGEGDVSADIDPIILTEGDTLWLDATGAAASNTTYKIIVRQTKQ